MSTPKPIDKSAEYVRDLDGFSPLPAKSATELYKTLAAQYYGKFKLAIISALPEELAALQAAADVTENLFHEIADVAYKVLHFRNKDDGNFREVILVSVSAPGPSATAIAAVSALKDFRAIEDIIAVGVAGGIPNPDHALTDVRVGDIVVSTESIAEYDMSKVKQDRVFPIASAQPPSQRLVAVVQQLEVDRKQTRVAPWEAHLQKCCAIEGAERPPSESDSMAALRKYEDGHDARRRAGLPVVHYGLIAAANPLARRSDLRDELRSFGVLAVERAGTGFTDAAWSARAGYLVIRGICDYCEGADDHNWRPHASACAAAYLKALIGSIPTLVH